MAAPIGVSPLWEAENAKIQQLVALDFSKTRSTWVDLCSLGSGQEMANRVAFMNAPPRIEKNGRKGQRLVYDLIDNSNAAVFGRNVPGQSYGGVGRFPVDESIMSISDTSFGYTATITDMELESLNSEAVAEGGAYFDRMMKLVASIGTQRAVALNYLIDTDGTGVYATLGSGATVSSATTVYNIQVTNAGGPAAIPMGAELELRAADDTVPANSAGVYAKVVSLPTDYNNPYPGQAFTIGVTFPGWTANNITLVAGQKLVMPLLYDATALTGRFFGLDSIISTTLGDYPGTSFGNQSPTGCTFWRSQVQPAVQGVPGPDLILRVYDRILAATKRGGLPVSTAIPSVTINDKGFVENEGMFNHAVMHIDTYRAMVANYAAGARRDVPTGVITAPVNWRNETLNTIGGLPIHAVTDVRADRLRIINPMTLMLWESVPLRVRYNTEATNGMEVIPEAMYQRKTMVERIQLVCTNRELNAQITGLQMYLSNEALQLGN